MGLPYDGFGMYESTNVALGQSVWGPNLQQLASMGMKVVLCQQAPGGHIGDLTAYINFAANLGMTVLIGLHDPAIWRDNTYSTKYPSMYADSGNAATGTLFAQYIVGQVKNLSGLYGYYVGDEPVSGDHATLSAYSGAIHTTDGSHPRVIVASASSGFSVSSGTNTYFDSCEILGDDYYPFQSTATYAFPIDVESKNVQSFCNSHSLSSIMVLQAFQWSKFGVQSASYPPLSEIRNKLDGVCRNSTPRLILWFSYNQTLIADTPQIDIQNIAYAIAQERILMAASVLLVQSGTNNGTISPATPGSLTTTAGNQLFLIVGIIGSSSPTISTPGGWTAVDLNNAGTTLFLAVYTQVSAGGATNPSVTLNGTITGWIAVMIEYSGLTGLVKQASAHPNVGSNPVPNAFVGQATLQQQANLFFLFTLLRAGNVTYSPVLTGPQWSSSIQSQVNVQGIALDTFWAGNTGPNPNFATTGGTLSVSELMVAVGAYYSIPGVTYPFSYDSVSGNEGVYVGSFNQGMIGG